MYSGLFSQEDATDTRAAAREVDCAGARERVADG